MCLVLVPKSPPLSSPFLITDDERTALASELGNTSAVRVEALPIQEDHTEAIWRHIHDLARKLFPMTGAMRLTTVEIPFGRSIQRHQTDLAHPRISVAVTSAESSVPSFFSISERAKGGEMFRWNPQSRKYAFYRFRWALGEHQPRIRPAPAMLCSSCHQSGGPIFSRFPWKETPFINRPLTEKMFAARAKSRSRAHPLIARREVESLRL